MIKSTMCLIAFSTPYWFILLSLLLFCLYLWSVANHKHYEHLGVAHDKPLPFFGSFKDLFMLRANHSEIFVKQYEKYKHRSYFGIFEHRKPVLVITDPSLIRRMAITDFNHFFDHGTVFKETSILGLTLRLLKGDDWRTMRATLEPIFSPQNVRFMSYLIEESCASAMQNLRNLLEHDYIETNILDFFIRFILDVGSATTLGMKPNSLSSEDNIFYKKIRAAFRTGFYDYLFYFMYGNFPSILQLINLEFVGYKYVSYFDSLVKEIIEYRKKHDIKRFDIIQLLLEKRVGDPNTETSAETHSPTDDEIVAQCFNVLLDGLVKSSLVAGCAAVELAANPKVQDKLQNEIDRFKELTRGETIPYNLLEEMSYLDMVIFETLRKWPTMYIMDRLCTKPCTLYDKSSSHSINLKPGDSVCVPIVALHNDPNYFPNPEIFYPERFSEEKRGFIKPYTFLPFGVGPRNCIGAKFGLMQIKAAVVCLLSEFRLELATEAHGPVLAATKGFVKEPKNTFIIKLRSRNNN